MQRDVYVYILVMATVTYLIRVLPLTLIRRQVKSTFLRSFLFYVPYV
ncbi:MAG: AzlD domain-containing protein, partial [Butyricicoccus pullicaecorum]|nr:AzlD domain-containing protein [Butyricicoccus pullicaecorum]